MISGLDGSSIGADDNTAAEVALAPPPSTSLARAAETMSAATLSSYERLANPIWIYDLEAGRIAWANGAGVGFWCEPTLEDLGNRPLDAADVFGDNVAGYRQKLERGQAFDGIWSARVHGRYVVASCRFAPWRNDAGAVQVLAEATAWWCLDDGPGPTPVAPGADSSRLDQFLEGQNTILRSIGKGAPLATTLEGIARFVARIVPSKLCVVQWLVDDRSRCRQVAAPIGLAEALQWWPPLADPAVPPPCQPDLARDDDRGAQQSEFTALACAPAGLDAICQARDLAVAWSTVVGGTESRPVGVLALLDSGPLTLDDDDARMLGAVAQLAGFAIENDRNRVALHSANDRLMSLAGMIPGVVYQRVVRPDGDIRYTYISDGARDLFGVSPEEILADPQALFDCHGREYYATFRERLMAASQALTMWDVEADIVTRDGQHKYTHAIARPLRQADGSVIWNGVILDQTRIKQAELAASAAETRTRAAIIASIPQGLALYDADDRLVTWNSQFARMYPALRDLLAPEAAYEDIVRAEIERGVDAASPAHAAGADDNAPAARLAERLALHRTDSHHFERRLADGRWILVNEHRTADAGTVSLHTDVTDLKDRQLALERSNRELQDFASIASHDLQEPLRKIEAFGDRLRGKCADELSDTASMYIERMQNAAGRMRSLINDLLAYSRVTTKGKPFQQLDLNVVAHEVLADLQVTIEHAGGRVEVADLPTIDADSTQLRQLFQNLISNALKFRRKDVPPVVRVSGRLLGPPGPDRPAEWCELQIADNGIGFEQKYADRIFGVFQRLHGRNDYDGTGIGLATCRKIAERHGGTIVATGAPAQGATFIITLPVKQFAGDLEP